MDFKWRTVLLKSAGTYQCTACSGHIYGIDTVSDWRCRKGGCSHLHGSNKSLQEPLFIIWVVYFYLFFIFIDLFLAKLEFYYSNSLDVFSVAEHVLNLWWKHEKHIFSQFIYKLMFKNGSFDLSDYISFVFWCKMHVNVIAPLVFERFSWQLLSFFGGKKLFWSYFQTRALFSCIFTCIPSAHVPTDLMQVGLASCRYDKLTCAWGRIDDIYAADALLWM